MLGGDDEPTAFWARFQELASNGTELLCLICQNLSLTNRRALHGVNRTMRKCMNATVTGICCSAATAAAIAQLQHEMFPNLNSLIVQRLSLTSNVATWRAYLQQLSDSTEQVVANLRHLSLTVPVKLIAAAEVSAIWELLTRYSTYANAPCVPLAQLPHWR